MRYLKFAFAGLLVLFILLTAIGLLMPSSVTVIRSVDINTPVDSVRVYTNDLANWRYWISGADSAGYKQLTASTKMVNSKIILGKYTITITHNDSENITATWSNEKNKILTSRIQLYNVPAAITTITWSFQRRLHWYPWERLGGMLHDKVFGPSMEVNLNKLKQLCEK